MLKLLVALAMTVTSQSDDRWVDYDAAEARLTAAYQALLAHHSGASRLTVRDAERQWITVRNRTCGFETRGRCATRLTREQAASLEKSLAGTRTYLRMDDRQLLGLVSKMNDACSFPGQDTEGEVCTKRDTIVRYLQRRGWCHGPDDAMSDADRSWMRMGPRCRNAHLEDQ